MEKLDSEIWEKNIKLLADRWPDLAAPLLQENAFFSPGVRLIDCRCGAKSCQVEGESGSWITLEKYSASQSRPTVSGPKRFSLATQSLPVGGRGTSPDGEADREDSTEILSPRP